MTNHRTGAVPSARPYQGFPYVNPAFTDVPSVPPAGTSQQTASQLTNTGSSQQTASQLTHSDSQESVRPNTLDLNEGQTSERPGPSKISLAQRELQVKYGQSRYIRNDDEATSPYVEETIFYDPFENRRIANPKVSPSPIGKATGDRVPRPNQSDDGSDDSEAFPSLESDAIADRDIQCISPSSPSVLAGCTSTAGPSTSSQTPGSSTPYYTKESGVYGGSSDVLPATIPMDQFPEPPPAYTEFDQTRPVSPALAPSTMLAPSATLSPITLQPPRTHVITTPTATVGQEPAAVLYHPSRKYVTCQFCRQHVLTVIKKEPGLLAHSCALFSCCVGCLPFALCAYCTDCLKEDKHYCPNCDLLVGTESRGRDGIVYIQQPVA